MLVVGYLLGLGTVAGLYYLYLRYVAQTITSSAQSQQSSGWFSRKGRAQQYQQVQSSQTGAQPEVIVVQQPPVSDQSQK